MPTRCEYPYTVCEMFFQGENASTTVKDEYGNIVTCGGDAKLTTTSPKFGVSCATFDGNDYINVGAADTARWTITKDFVLISWIKFTSTSGYQNPFGISNTQLRTRFYNGTSISTYYGTSTATDTKAYTTGTWYPLIMCRSGSTCRTFFNGSRLTNVTKSGTINSDGSGLVLGSYQQSAVDQNLNGQIGYILFCNGYCPTALTSDVDITVDDYFPRGNKWWF